MEHSMETEHNRLRTLSREEIDKILFSGFHAHLGCYHADEVYVLPITYIYDRGCIYSHTLSGKKLKMMRANPKVCVQVEDVTSLFNWRSVIAWGHFEELKREGEEAEQAIRLLKYKIAELNPYKNASSLEVEFEAQLSEAKVFRIKIDKVTGREEKR